ncbi:putative toxin-antitoxin system toxin component, PIN family [Gemmatimonadota bacterium]
MDRLFLDANILFSAAYRPGSGLSRLWHLDNVELVTSDHAITEAYRNLQNHDPLCLQDLNEMIRDMIIVKHVETRDEDPDLLSLPEKDQPILKAAMVAGATHLITGDKRHFGQWFGKRVKGIIVQSPGDYLRDKQVM